MSKAERDVFYPTSILGDMCPVKTELTVTELLKKCAQRPPDEAAWAEFVRRYHSVIRTKVAKTFNRKARNETDRRPQFPDDLIEDLIQGVYMRLIGEKSRAIKQFEGLHENSIYQYLGIISTNVVLDYFREAKALKRPKISLSLDEMVEKTGDSTLRKDSLTEFDANPASDPNSTFFREEIEAALKRAVTGRHRERDITIFKFRFYDGLTLEEIRQIMNLDLSPISIGSILNRIIAKLKRLLNPPSARQ
jgi:RNA polymerase sigma factor (sigma-70 family)